MIHIMRRGVYTRFTISTTKTVFNEAPNEIHRSKILWRGRSLAASVPSDTPKARKGGKRLSKDQRKALLVSYVNEYRETHDGKFPSSSEAKKQVGGSYYVVRKIIQELEYESKISSTNAVEKNMLGKKLTRESQSSAKVENVLSREVAVDAQTQYDPHVVAVNDVEVDDIGDKHVKSGGVQQTSGKLSHEELVKTITPDGPGDLVATENNLWEGDGKDASLPCSEKAEIGKVEESHGDDSDFTLRNSQQLKGEIDDQSLEKPVDYKKEKDYDQKLHTSYEDTVDTDGPKHKERSPEPEKHAKETDDEPKISTLWGNLKAFADGIISIWKNR